MVTIQELPKSTPVPIADLEIFTKSILFLGDHIYLFVLVNLFLVFCLLFSIAKWKRGTKDFKKITNRYTIEGEKKKDTRAPINFELLAILFLVVNLGWIVVTIIAQRG